VSEPIDPKDPRVQRKMHPLHRTELLVGREGFARLNNASACVVGLGGVGSWAAEALLRSGVGHITVVDYDDVCITNLNRQLLATRQTVGRNKAEVMVERMLSILPKADVRGMGVFYSPDTAADIFDRQYDVVLDCIDNMTAKVHLLQTCVRKGIRVVSSMGAGGRMDPTQIRVGDVSKTRRDPFARIVRDLLRQRGIETGVECVWSDETPSDLDPFVQTGFQCICPGKDANEVNNCESRFQVQGTVPWITAQFGMTLAGVAVNRLLERPIHDADTPKKTQRPAKTKLPKERKRELLAKAPTESA